MEDYFAIHEIVDDATKVRRFKDTLFEKARKWAQTLDYNKVKKFDWDEKAKEDPEVSIKYWFMRRFAKESRTLEAAYDAWKSLSFDPSKDDMEELINTVVELAEKLGYNEDAQVMAIKSVLPRDVYGLCLAMKTTKELKEFLVELFANPRMRDAVSGMSSFSGDTTAFSMGQQVSTSIVNPTVADIDKIKNDIEVMQNRFNKMSTADSRTRVSNRRGNPR